jgi:tRNA-Thr(GGU) m(6)t(6)A37 methyltransferase TsaA
MTPRSTERGVLFVDFLYFVLSLLQMNRNGISLEPIGFVSSPVKQTPRPEHDWTGIVSEIVVEPEFSAGLEGLERYSHVIVIYWANKATDKSKMALRVRYRGDSSLPEVGVFASRSLFRPNPLGMKVTRLLERKDNILRLEGLDALDGTPVLDIKPFIPSSDAPEGARVPEWK